MSVVIDLRAKTISSTTKVWIVHSGRDRGFFPEFEGLGGVFLNYPDMQLRPDVLEDDEALRQQIRFARAVRAARGPVRDNGSTINLSDFHGLPGPEVQNPLRTVKHLASRISDGDLVVVPGRGAQGRVLFGEADGPFRNQDRIRTSAVPYGELPFRKVRWIKTDIYKGDLPPRLIRYFEKPPAIAEVDRSSGGDEFFDYAYDSYTSDYVSWASLTASAYDGTDLRQLLAPTELVVLGLALFCAAEQNADISRLSYSEIIVRFYDASILTDAQFSFSSPGRVNLRDAGRRAAQFVNAFVALAIAGALVGCSAQGAQVVNSASPNDSSTAAMEVMINRAVNSAGDDVLKKAQEQGTNAKISLNLKTPATVKR